MKGLLEGKVALVTGGVRGIGLAISEKFAQNGADLVVTTTKDPDSVADVLDHLRSYGGRVEAVRLDPSEKAEVAAAMPQIISTMGRLDVLVNNAGITRDGLLLRMSEEDWDAVLKVDLKSAYNTIQAVLPTMMRQRGGS
ncbi:MAG: SDR family NAD(P)-dependent oxidoreductase, partial [Bacteroidales bacterium]|nr:SDR family NAD(P)-dependent oxidoreductase [Candidatus Cryptobacteroides equifaecalis]